jgi:WD40 repeat protein
VLVLEGESAADGLRFTTDGTRLLAARRDGGVDVRTPATGERAELLPPLNLKRDILKVLVLHTTGAVRVAYGEQPVAASLSGRPPSIVVGVGGVEQLIISPNWVVVTRPDFGGQRLAGCRCGPDLDFGGKPAWQARPHVSHETLLGFVSDDRFVTLERNLLIIRDVTTGEVRTAVNYPSRHYRCCAVSHNGRRLAVMGYDKLYLWDTATWGAPTRVPGLNRWVRAMAYHPTRPILLTAQDRLSLVKYLDADTGKAVRKFDWKLGMMRSVAFSPDGTLAAAGGADGKIVVWDVDE